jgi:adhesin/invasin
MATGLLVLLGPAAATAAATTQITLQLSPTVIAANGTATSTATATVDGVPPFLDTVAFTSTDSGDTITAQPHNPLSNTYTATITSTSAGQSAIKATDSTASLSATATLIKYGPAAHVAVTLNPNTIVPNGTSTSTAAATVTDALGDPVPGDTVAFTSSDPGERISATTNGNGTYTATITSSTTPGAATITATDRTAGISGDATLTQTSTGSGTTLSVSPPNPVTNQPVTLTAAVSSTPVAPAGTVTFADGGTPIPGCVAEAVSPSSPTVVCQTSFAAATSPHTVTANYSPSGKGATASTGQRILVVGKDATTTSLTGSVSSHSGNRGATYTAAVNPGHPGPVTPTGSVQFMSGGAVISGCANQPLTESNGVATATCNLGRDRNVQSISAQYLGDGNFLPSTSQPAQRVATITSTMSWSFFFTPHFTVVRKLHVRGVPSGAEIVVICSGKGCPFHRRTTNVKHGCAAKSKTKCGRTITLESRFGKHHLAVGSRIVVEVVRPSWIGKYYGFTIRSARGPRVKISCLAPGQNRPGIGC